MHYYHTAPIDYWLGALDTKQLLDILKDHHTLDSVGDAANQIDELRKMVEESGPHWKKLGWEGDIRQGPFFFAVPGDGSMRFGCIVKQDNNGNCFVASPVPLEGLNVMG